MTKLSVPDIHCEKCVERITKALTAENLKFQVSPADKTVTVDGVALDDGNGGGNYDVTYVANTSSTIDKASATVIANSGTFTYNGQTQNVSLIL